MKVEMAAIGTLIEYGFNNRMHPQSQIDRIANSIRDFGFNQPIVVDENNVLLIGHGRLAAARKLGLQEVPVVILRDLTETQKRAYRILDNKLSDDAEWDTENLRLELDRLTEDGYEFENWGLDDLLDTMTRKEVDPNFEEEDLPNRNEDEIFLKRGDLIELGKHRLLCGDSADEKDLRLLANDEKIDLLLTDPPYNLAEKNELAGASKSASLKKLKEADWDKRFIPEQFLATSLPYLSPDCWVSIFTSHHLFGEINSFLENKIGDTSFFVWCKPNPMPSLQKRNYISAVELCILAKRGKPTFNYPSDGHAYNYLVQGRKSFGDHPTPKTPEVISELMQKLSNKNQTVFDLFAGSGTTLIVAEELNRQCYAMELSPTYCQVILDRFISFTSRRGWVPSIKINEEVLDVTAYVAGKKL